MPSANADNVGGHRMKYETLKKNYSPEQAAIHFVGSSDPFWTGYMELEVIRRFKSTKDLRVVDVGCGIGRLTKHVLHEPVASYLGIDIIPEIMQEAEKIAEGDSRFRFEIGKDCKIPVGDASVDIVLAFSVITHLLDEETFEYFQEARRVLAPGGVGVFSFLDFMAPAHQKNFFLHAKNHRHGHGDLLKFSTQEVLSVFSQQAGFSSVEFQAGSVPVKTSGLTSSLVPADQIPPTVVSGQSLCIMRV